MTASCIRHRSGVIGDNVSVMIDVFIPGNGGGFNFVCAWILVTA